MSFLQAIVTAGLGESDIVLNGDSATITFYEDTDLDGVAENQETFTIVTGANEYDLSNFDASEGNEIWWTVQFTDDNDDITDAGFINSVVFE